MEAIGVAASFAGLISLTEMVVLRASRYCSLVRSARSDIRELLFELQSLCGVLKSLEILAKCLEEDDPSYGKKNLPRLDHFQTCRQNLDTLKKALAKMDLDSARGLPAAKIKLLWPFKDTEMTGLLEKIGRNKKDLSDALTADGITSLVNALSTAQSRLSEDIAGVQRELMRVAEEKAENEIDERKRKIFDWCSDHDPFEKHRQSTGLRHPQTLTWLFDSPEYLEWLQDSNTAIWLYGIPGAGKTILSSAIIEDAKMRAYQKSRHAIAFYYCEYKKKETQILSNVVGSLIKQICVGSEEAFQELESLYARYHEKGKSSIPPSTGDLIMTLKCISRRLDCVMLIVDGLDECPLLEERRALLELFSTLHHPDQGNIKAIYASRDEIDIREQFTDLNQFQTISIAARGTDLELFVAAEIELRISNKSLRLKDSSLKEYIVERIVTKANGMFQWAKCQLDHLCLLSTDRERRKALDSLPKDLFETYQRILDRVNAASESNKSLVERTLRWLCFSPIIMNLESLTTVVAVEINSVLLHQDDIPDEHSLLWWCSSLVSRDSRGGVSLSHFTVREFLVSEMLLRSPALSRFHMEEKASATIIAKVCLTYLNFVEISKKKVDIIDGNGNDSDLDVLYLASQAWPQTASGHDDDDNLFRLACRLLHPRKPPSFFVWLHAFYMGGREPPRATPTLHFAATFGLERVCGWLLDKGADINFIDSLYATPLICSVRGWSTWRKWENSSCCSWTERGRSPNPETVRFLLSKGAVASADRTITKPSMSRRGEESVKLTPMALALDICYFNFELGSQIFKTLLEFGAVSSFSNSSLWVKSDSLGSNSTNIAWRKNMVDLFLESLEHPFAQKLESDSREKMYLFIASHGHGLEGEEFNNLQIGTGDMFTSDISVAQLVTSAAENGQQQLIEELIAKDVPSEILLKGLAPAAESGFLEIVKLLLTRYNSNDPSHFQSMKEAWMNAASEAKVDCLKLFLANGISVNTEAYYRIPEEWIRGRAVHLEEVLHDEKKIDTEYLGTALACAVHHGALDAITFLISIPDVDLTAKVNGHNLFHLAAKAPANRSEIVDILQTAQDKVLDPLETSTDGRSVLHHLLGNPNFSGRDIPLFLSFVKHGCKLDAVDKLGNTLLHIIFEEHFTHGHGVEYRNDQELEFELKAICSIISYLIEQCDTTWISRKDGLLPLQIAVRKHLPSRIIEMSIPHELSSWNSNGENPYSILHEAVRPKCGYDRYYDQVGSLRILQILLKRKQIRVRRIRYLDVNITDSTGKTPLLLACDASFKGAPQVVAQIIGALLEAGSDVDYEGADQWRPIHRLAFRGYVAGLVEILRYKPDMQAKNMRGGTSFHDAVERGHLEVVRLLIQHEQQIQDDKEKMRLVLGLRTNNGMLPMHFAAQDGHDDILDLLHDAGLIDNINDPTTAEKLTPLHLAAEGHHISTARLLIKLGADLEALDEFGSTALHLAAEQGHKDMVELLLEHGANVTAEDASRCSPWMRAAIGGHQEVKDTLMKLANAEVLKAKQTDQAMQSLAVPSSPFPLRSKSPGLDPVQIRINTLVNALSRGDAPLCKALLESGIRPDEPLDQFKRPALCIAASLPNTALLESLLELEADINVRDMYGNTPIHHAAMSGELSNLELLYRKGATFDCRNREMQTPLHEAAKNGYADIVSSIVSLHSLPRTAVVPPEAKDESALEPCTKESTLDERRAVWLERDPARHRKLLDAVDTEHKTALVIALEARLIRISELLIDAGADVHIKDVYGRDALWMCVFCHDKFLLKKILSENPSVGSGDYLGFDCLHNLVSGSFVDRRGLVTMSRILMEAGFELHSNNMIKASPLHSAAAAPNGRMLKEFLRLVAKEEIDVESSYYGTPLYAATFRSHVGAVKMLLAAGANPHLGFKGKTPLEVSKDLGYTRLTAVLEKSIALSKSRAKSSRFEIVNKTARVAELQERS